MIRTFLMGLLVATFALPSAAQAGKKSLRKALAGLEECIEEVSDDSKSCSKAVRRDLRDIQESLEKAVRRPKAKKIKRMIRDLEDAEDEAKEECDRSIRKQLKRVRKRLEEYLEDEEEEDEEDEDDDRDRDRDSGDDGPISHMAFSTLQDKLQNASSDKKRLKHVKRMLGDMSLTSIQMGFILVEFKKEKRKFQAYEYCTPRLSDPENAILIPATYFADPRNQRNAKKILKRVRNR